MNLKDLDIDIISLLISETEQSVTCIECCNYYTVPSRAMCGHSLCHSCWRFRRVCPYCAYNIDKRSLMLNLPLQSRTENVKNMIKMYEEVFNIVYDSVKNLPVEEGSNKNVKTWLRNNENDFSISNIEGQESVPRHQDSLHLTGQDPTQFVKQITSKIQIHSVKKKVRSPKNIIHVTPQQDDWDKIEEMPEIETNFCKPKENSDSSTYSFGFLFDGSLFPSKNNNNNKIAEVQPIEKHSSKATVTNVKEIAKKLNDPNAINKEFDKLAKKYSNKNASINENDNPQIRGLFEEDANISSKENVQFNSQHTDVGETVIRDVREFPLTHKKVTTKKIKGLTKANNTNKNSLHFVEKGDLNSVEPDKYKLNSKQASKNVKQPNVSFYQRGSLNKPTIVKNTENLSKQDHFTKLISSVDNDEIEITIKTGALLTNICIYKKQDDIKLKVNSEKQIQTYLNNVNIDKNTSSCTLDLHNNVLDINTNIANNNENVLKNKGNIKLNSKMLEVIEKSTPSKKGTASADTLSIQNEIIESIEVNTQNEQFSSHTQKASQLINTPNKPKANEVQIKNYTQNTLTPDNMVEDVDSRNEEKSIGAIKSLNSQNGRFDTHSQDASQLLNKTSDEVINSDIVEDVQSINSIFDSEPIEDTNIKLLKSTEKTLSSILTMKTNTSKSHRDERNRNDKDLKDFRTNKKRKLPKENEYDGHLECSLQPKLKKNKTLKEIVVLETDSESLNYEMLSQLLDIEKDTNKINSINAANNKCSENIFSLSKESQDSDVPMTANFKTHVDNTKSQPKKPNEELEITKKLKKLSSLNDVEVIEFGTPEHDDDSDKSVVEDTPQKAQSFTINKNTIHTQNTQQLKTVSQPISKNIETKEGSNIISLSDTMEESTFKNNITVIETNRETLDTPLNIAQFAGQITHKSTPLARKSLNFNMKDGDFEPTQGPSSFVAAKTTQEKEFLSKAFDTTSYSESQIVKKVKLKFCVAGSCLTGPEQARLKLLCSQRHWTYVDKYSKEVTHLVVGVDEENKSQRSVKYMCALAGAKWIISYDWVEKCLQTNNIVDEEAFEALDGTGEPGPRRSRLSKRRIFEGITFYCMPPFSVLDIDTLKDILRSAGGRVVEEPEAVRARDGRAALLLAEPENTQQDKFIYLAMKLDVVPVNYEWVLNCLGSYTLGSIHDLLLCSSTLLPKATEKWPSELMLRDFN